MLIVTPSELKKRMDSLQGVFILDVRPAAAFEQWRIEGPGVTTVNIQNSKLKANGVQSFKELPTNREIVAVCAKGRSAQETVALLSEAGYKACLLMGGMAGWSEYYSIAPVVTARDYSIYQILRPGKGCLSYFILSGTEALVVDAGRHVDVYTDLATQLGVTIVGVVDTHLHADHVSGSRSLAEACQARYYIGEEEWDTPREMRPRYEPLNHMQTLSLGTKELTVYKTPGHTLASLCIQVDRRYLVAGDTLFVNGVGRPDLKGKAREMAELMFHSLHDVLLKLPFDTTVLPGHYSSYEEINAEGFVGAKLGQIVQRNQLCRIREKQTFCGRLLERIGVTPPNYETMIQMNRHLLTLPLEQVSELETGPNRCSVQV